MKEMYRYYKNTECKTRQNGGSFISEKRCDDYAHSQEDDYNEALKAFYDKDECQNPRHPKT